MRAIRGGVAFGGALLGLLAAPLARAAEPTPAATPAAIVLAQAAPSEATGARPPHRLPPPNTRGDWKSYRSHVAVGSINGDGLDTITEVGWRRKTSSRDTLLFRDSYLSVGISPRANPSYSRVGPVLEVQPIAFFHLAAGAEYVQYFSTFGNLQSYPTPRAEHSDRARGNTAGRAYATGAFHATVEPTLRAKVGPVAARYRLTAEWWDADLAAGDTVFYASNTDLLVPDGGWVLTDTADLLLLPRDGVVVGARWTRTHAKYRGGDDPNAHERAGVLAAYTPRDRGWSVGRPTAFVMAGWYLSHRYRAGDATARATPSLVFGVAFQAGSAR